MTTLLRVISIMFMLSLAVGCTTAPPDMLPPGHPPGHLADFIGGKPVWIDNYPTDPDFYIGIGSSRTGDKGEDMDLAKTKALVNLASSISTDIRSELLIRSGESSRSGVYETVDQVIRETVDTNVREVEVADSYYSPEEGYWFYLRLNKSVWESIQREEADRLARRVVGIVEPVLADDSASIASRLRALWKGRSLLVESPYGQHVETILYGKEGVLLDLIDNLITAYIDSFNLEFEPKVVKTRGGRAAPVAITVKSTFALKPGEVLIRLSLGTNGDPSVDITTDEEGVYEGEIAFPREEPGSIKIGASMNLESFGIKPGMMPGRILVPETEAMLVVSAIPAYLLVAAPEGMDVPGIRQSFERLFSAALPVELSGPTEADFEISVDVIAREAPKNDFGLIITYIKVFISVSRDGAVLESFESPEVKDGGITLSQAYTRTFAVLMDALANSPDLTEKLEKAILVTTS